MPGPLAGGDAPRAPVGSAERRLPARRIGIDARRDPRGPRRLGTGGDSRHARGRHRRRRRLRGKRAGRSPAVGARRAVRARVGPGGRCDRRRGGGAPGGRDLPSRHAAADRAALRRQRHLRRGRGRDRRRGRPGHPARRRHARRRVGRRGAGRRAGRATRRAGRRDDRSHRPAAVDDHDRSHPSAAGRWRDRGHPRARPRAGRHRDPVQRHRRRTRLSRLPGGHRAGDRSVQPRTTPPMPTCSSPAHRRSSSPPTMPSAPPTSSRPSRTASWR